MMTLALNEETVFTTGKRCLASKMVDVITVRKSKMKVCDWFYVVKYDEKEIEAEAHEMPKEKSHLVTDRSDGQSKVGTK